MEVVAVDDDGGMGCVWRRVECENRREVKCYLCIHLAIIRGYPLRTLLLDPLIDLSEY